MKTKRKYITISMCIGVMLSSLSLQNVLVYATDDIQDTQEVDKKEVSEEEVRNDLEASIGNVEELNTGKKIEILNTEIVRMFALPRVAGGSFTDNSTGVGIKYSIPDSAVFEVNVGMDNTNKAVDIKYTGEVIIPEKVTFNGNEYAVTGIATYAFTNSQATKIVMPDSITEIGIYAFEGSHMTNPPNLKNVVSIRERAFFETKKIVGPTYITKTTTLIGSDAFKRSGITTFYLDYNGKNPWLNSDNYPFFSENEMQKAVVVKDYDTYKKIRAADGRVSNTVTYEVDIVFRDRNGEKIDSIAPHKALYGKPLYCQKQSDESWEMNKDATGKVYATPAIPDEYKAEYDAWSPSILGGATFSADTINYYPQILKKVSSINVWPYIGGDIVDNDETTMGVYLASSRPYGVKNLSRTFDDAFVKPEFDNLDNRYVTKGNDKQGNLLYLYSINKVNISSPNTGRIQYNWATSIKFKNVAESGTYYFYAIQQCFGKEYSSTQNWQAISNQNWQADEAIGTMRSFTVDIKPATIVINPPKKIYVGVKDGVYLLPDLNVILGKEGDTQGSYTWESLIPPTSNGTYEYSYKFVPNNLTAKSPFTNADVDNYTEKEKTGTVTLVYTDPKEIEGIELNKSSVKMDLDVSETLTAKFIKENATGDRSITWASSNEAVATVNKYGRITSVALGEATITATTENGKTATCKVKVMIPKPIEKVTLDREEVTLEVGNDRILNSTVTPLDTTDDKEISWTSSDESIATVDTTGKVVAKNVGKALITATTTNGKKAICKVVVVAITTIPDDVETYPDPEDGGTEIKDRIDEIFATKKKYEALPDESKKEIYYDIVEKLNELLRNFDEIETNVVVKTPDDIENASAKNLAEALDKDDVDKLIVGSHTANVELVMENIDKGKVNDKELALFKEKQLEWEVANFIDINLVKTMTEVGGTSTITKTDIFEVAQPIKIKLDIPKNIRGKSEYAVLRHHGGVVTELKDEDTDPNTITFFTNKFSTYNIVYKDNTTHSVNFDFMGGVFNGQLSPIFETEVTQNSAITTYPNKEFITKQGYIFAGWYIDKEYTKEWNFEQDKVTSAMTLYARWNVAGSIPTQPNDPASTGKGKVVETGDSTTLWPYYVLIVVSGFTLLLGVNKKRNKVNK